MHSTGLSQAWHTGARAHVREVPGCALDLTHEGCRPLILPGQETLLVAILHDSHYVSQLHLGSANQGGSLHSVQDLGFSIKSAVCTHRPWRGSSAWLSSTH